MEKVIYLLWRDAATEAETFAQRLRSELTAKLKDVGVRGARLNLQDEAVKPAAGLRQLCMKPPFDAVLQLWIDSAVTHLRQPIDAVVAAHAGSMAAYLVTESQPLRNLKYPPRSGARTEGFAQMAVLRRPSRLDYVAWIDIWHNFHTRIAIETQSTFEYVQNVIVRPLTPDAPAIDAIVEECFPQAAMTDYKVYFEAPGDDEKFKRNLARMMDSVGRFIDPGTIDVLPTSQYQLFRLWD